VNEDRGPDGAQRDPEREEERRIRGPQRGQKPREPEDDHEDAVARLRPAAPGVETGAGLVRRAVGRQCGLTRRDGSGVAAAIGDREPILTDLRPDR
jgi:hypothetical protein